MADVKGSKGQARSSRKTSSGPTPEISTAASASAAASGGGGVRKVVVNVETTVYETIRSCARDRGWALQERSVDSAGGARGYNIYWTDRSVTRTRVQRLEAHQMLNHFPGMVSLFSKVSLSQPRTLSALEVRTN